MTIDPKGFPLDLTGKNPRNEVTGETRTLSSNEEMTFVPDGGPFFTDSLIVRSGTRVLRPVADYKCLHLVKDATIRSGMDVSAIVHIIDNTISSVTLQYQVIGGEYGNTVTAIRQLLENADTVSKGVNWNTQVYAKPDVFPPAPHFVAGEDFSSWNDVVLGIDNIHRAIAYKDKASWNSVYTYMDRLISNRIAEIDLGSYYTRSQVNEIANTLALKSQVYTKTESQSTFYTKQQVDALIGDIDGNETYYTESEINAKFIERVVADGKYATKTDFTRLDNKKADLTEVYTRAQSTDRFADKTLVYSKEYIDANFTTVGTAYTKKESDTRYARVDASYTKSQGDQRYALKSQIPQAQDLTKFPTRDEVDNRYLKITNADLIYLRKTTADATYAKHSDLDVIDVLNRKFNNYYTKTDSDSKFVTNTHLTSTYDTSADVARVYGTKNWVTKTYLSIARATVLLDDVDTKINTKIDTNKVIREYASLAWTSENFYTKNLSDLRYYTRAETDIKFITKVDSSAELAKKLDISAHSTSVRELNRDIDLRLKITDATRTYYSKTETNSLFATGSYVAGRVNELKAEINKKASSHYLLSNYYNKTETDKRYLTASFIDSNYYNKSAINGYFLRKSEFNDKIKDYAKTSTLTASINSVRGEFDNYYSKREADTRYYTRGLANSTFVKNSSFNEVVNSINNSINTKQPISQMRLYAQLSYLKATHPTKNDLKAYATTALVNRDYISKTSYSAGVDAINKTIADNLTYVKNNYWSRSEINTLFYTKSFISSNYYTREYIHSVFATKSLLVNELKPMVTVKLLEAQIASVKTLLQNFYSKTESNSRYYTKSETQRTFVKTDDHNKTVDQLTANINSRLTSAHLRPYATIDYAEKTYLKKADLGNYASEETVNKLYVRNAVFNAFSSATQRALDGKADKSYVDGNFYTRSAISQNYLTKEYINSNFARTTVIAATYTTANTFKAFTAKAALKSDLQGFINEVDKLSKATASLDYVRNVFQFKSDMGNYYTKSDVNKLFLTQKSAAASYATTKWVNDQFMNKSDADLRYNLIRRALGTIEEKIGYRIGDLFLTTKHFKSSSQVHAHLGYGTWERYAMGRALVGYSPSSWVDAKHLTLSASNLDMYNNEDITRMGYSFGAYRHTLTLNEMPNHKHTIYQRLNDRKRNNWAFYNNKDEGIFNTKADYDKWGYSKDAKSTETAGTSQSHENRQPSIIIGVWKRIA